VIDQHNAGGQVESGFHRIGQAALNFGLHHHPVDDDFNIVLLFLSRAMV
jgi:hypothetical protein